MTVHKSQGMSMDAAIIDLSKAFEYGQGYVALSRVRRLAGLYLLGCNARALEVHPEILERDQEFRAASSAVNDAFHDMPKAERELMRKRFIKAMGGAWRAKPKQGTPMKRSTLPGRLAETLQAVRDAASLRDAAKVRGLTTSTIVTHLEELSGLEALSSGDFAHLVPEDARYEIHEALRDATDEKLSPVFHALHGKHSFELIRLTRLLRQ